MKLMKDRNSEIYNLYKKGFKIEDLIKLYNLSEDSIRELCIVAIQKQGS